MTLATDSAQPISAEELARMPGVGPCELVGGRIVAMRPTGGEHARIEGDFYTALEDLCAGSEAGSSTRRRGRNLYGPESRYGPWS